MKTMKYFFEHHFPWVGVLITIFLTLGFLYLIEHFGYYLFHNYSSWYALKDIQSLYAASLVILTASLVYVTALIVWVAWFQADRLNKTTKNEFLLRLDERYSSPEILQARQILFEMRPSKSSDNCDYKTAEQTKFSLEILEKYKNKSPDFIYLFNLLDYLESLGYFWKDGAITTSQVQDLFGTSIWHYYLDFEEFIKHTRSFPNSDSSYKEFENLANEMLNNKD